MSLERFIRQITPMLLGRVGPEETAGVLWGPRPPQPDARRLALYARFCRGHRFDAVDHVYGEVRAAVVARGGEQAWEGLVEGYFAAHPMRSVELNENGSLFPEHLRDALPPGLPAWLPELADLEGWSWRTYVAGDAESDRTGNRGPARLASTVELRSYQHDLVSWLDSEGERPNGPARKPVTVLFWRDSQLRARRELASVDELRVLKCVWQGAPLAESGLAPASSAAIVEDLRAAGIVLGGS